MQRDHWMSPPRTLPSPRSDHGSGREREGEEDISMTRYSVPLLITASIYFMTIPAPALSNGPGFGSPSSGPWVNPFDHRSGPALMRAHLHASGPAAAWRSGGGFRAVHRPN